MGLWGQVKATSLPLPGCFEGGETQQQAAAPGSGG